MYDSRRSAEQQWKFLDISDAELDPGHAHTWSPIPKNSNGTGSSIKTAVWTVTEGAVRGRK